MKPAVYFACFTAMSLGGCSILSSAGPLESQVVAAGQADNEVLFDVVEVDNRVVSTLLAQPKESFHARFEKDRNPPELKIAVGDTVSVTIWESAAGGLFNEVPPQQPPTGSRPATEPLAPESPRPPTETPAEPNPGIDQLFGLPNPPGGTPNQPPGAPSETPPPGQTPSGNIRQSGPLPIEATGAAVAQRSATIPDQQVARDGAIVVPFAGQVPAAGRTPAEVQQTIETLLASKALQPQALVIVKRSAANTVTVAGEVVAGARIPLSLGGDRLLQVIAAAGGAATPAGIAAVAGITTPAGIAAAGGITARVYETFVRLSRDGVTATIPFERLVADPAEDIYARPGDVLTLVRIPQTFSVFGATGRNDLIAFDAEKLTLSEALAKSQGLRDDLANPKGVFLFRYEPTAIVRALDQPIAAHAQDGTSPVAYRFDFSDANSYLIADQFPVRDKDIIFVADAAAVQVQQLFAALQTITGPVITGLLVCRSGGTSRC
ncbi:MAG TPA: polysaccharide biosynthesis/export family protein [Stellaceae bacterium]|jgi:polysaccharide export outer membrane protein|nr:polysaccharide biosynthesis/export family protein [Stellaceae bacterium]